ncbi:MAG TPA: hypothetical protein VE978_04210 [Chitinophagales bacterium]|nr:hypothetical protein [Chitinophagales bacterium]
MSDSLIRWINIDTLSHHSHLYVELNDPPPINENYNIEDSLLFESDIFKLDPDSIPGKDPNMKRTIFSGSIIDSTLSMRDSLNSFQYVKRNSNWYLQSFEIKSSQFHVGELKIGMTSKDVFTSFHRQPEKADDKYIVVRNGEERYLQLNFVNDHLFSIKLIQ